MTKKIVFIKIFLCSLIFGVECTSDDFEISCEINESLVGLYLNSFDLNTNQSSLFIFDCLVEKASDSDCDDYSNLNLSINYNINIQSPILGIEHSRSFFSGVITLSEIYSDNIQFKNTDLNNYTSSVVGSQNINFQLIDFDFSVDIRNSIIQSGKVPNGTYQFSFSIQDCLNSNSCISINEIKIYQPENLYLQFPGGLIDDLNNNFIFSTIPTFFWNADFCSNCEISIRVCEYDPLRHISLNDAINDISNLPTGQFSGFQMIDSGNYISYQYPIVGSMPLEYGNSYVWQIKYSYTTTMVTRDVFSEIFVFNIKSPYQKNLEVSGSTNNQSSNVLKNILGYEKYKLLFTDGGNLEAYIIDGDNIFINNNKVSITELLNIANLINEGKLEFIDVKIEY